MLRCIWQEIEGMVSKALDSNSKRIRNGEKARRQGKLV